MEAKKQKPGRFVLQTSSGQVLRVLNWESQAKTYVVERGDTGRIELATADSIRPQDIKIKAVTKQQVHKAPVELSEDVELAYVSSVFFTEKNVPVADEEKQDQKFGSILRVTGVAHVGVVLLCLLLGMVIEPWLQPEETIVKIVPQKKITKPQVSKTVKVSETKIDRRKKVSKRKVVSRKVKPKKYAKKSRATRSKVRRGQARTKINVAKTGALGVLGGMKSGSKNSAGLNLNSVSNSRGSGVSGRGGRGGHSRALPGKGLIAAGVGTGGKARGSGGYGTSGKGGGRPGYGKMSMRGASGAYFQPLEEEALIQGGLDREQIAAVINRNMGQIVYCYEKGLQTKPSLSGRVNVRWVIGANGRVRGAKIAS
ncbi:MAG: AgmX/PglI C-terminal domain-containing protein, partial [Pseudomonadota bacterium]